MVTKYVELLYAIERANAEIAEENATRAKRGESMLYRRITLVD